MKLQELFEASYEDETIAFQELTKWAERTYEKLSREATHKDLGLEMSHALRLESLPDLAIVDFTAESYEKKGVEKLVGGDDNPASAAIKAKLAQRKKLPTDENAFDYIWLGIQECLKRKTFLGVTDAEDGNVTVFSKGKSPLEAKSFIPKSELTRDKIKAWSYVAYFKV